MLSPASICSTCDFACKKPRRGPCACSVDGIDILVHIEKRDCPKGYHVNAPPAPVREPRLKQPIAPVPRDTWPLSAHALAYYQKPSDKGIGDTVARLLDKLRAGDMAAWYERITGAKCGCEDRKARLNALYPYESA